MNENSAFEIKNKSGCSKEILAQIQNFDLGV